MAEMMTEMKATIAVFRGMFAVMGGMMAVTAVTASNSSLILSHIFVEVAQGASSGADRK